MKNKKRLHFSRNRPFCTVSPIFTH